jgi:hypothetical protein
MLEAKREEIAVPRRSILILEQDEIAGRVAPSRRPRGVERHQRDEGMHAGRGDRRRIGQSQPQAQGLAAEIRADDVVAAAGGVAFVEQQVDHVHRGLDARGQRASRRHLEGHATRTDAPLRADQSLRHRTLVTQQRARDLPDASSSLLSA